MDFEKLKEIRNMGYIKHTGIRTVELREGYAKAEIVLDERHANPIGSTHGGVLFTLVDTVGGAAATSRGRYVTTVSGNINYLRPAMNCKKLIGESREIKIGKKMCVYDVMITDENDREIAKATMTFFYLDKINAQNIAKGKEITGVSRVKYDLKVLYNKYDSYLKFLEKQKILEAEAQSDKTDEKLILTTAPQPKTVETNNNSDDSLDDLLIDIFG